MSKKSGADRKRNTRLNAQVIEKIFSRQNQALTWRELVTLVGAEDPRSITQLRQVLKGMERNGELQRDHQGAYHLVAGAELQTGIVERSGKALHVDGLAIDASTRSPLREGDAVEYRDVADNARVMRVTAHADAPLVGILHTRGSDPYVEALGAQKGSVSLSETPSVGRHGDTVTVEITGHDRQGWVGRVVEVLAADSVVDQAITTALAAGGIPHEWPQAVEHATQRLPKSVQAGRLPKRVDLTGVAFVTIDGETARDFDDAVFAEALTGGRTGWRLLVAIADVGHYVKPGSALDEEALQRGTSVYFPERVVPMLPEVLSNGLCSLQPDVPRLTLVCDMQIGSDGQVRHFDFCEAVIHSHARLTYTGVQGYLSDGRMPPVSRDEAAVRRSLDTLVEVYQALRQYRERRGALDFPTREATLQLSQGRIASITPVARMTAHQIIEEAMIAANVCAATFLEAHDQPALYRVHEPPDPAKLEELRQALHHVGVRMPGGAVEPRVMQAALAALPEHGNTWLYAQLALRSLKQAVYTPKNEGHYGLALERYMHFTSPIRRYPDLNVHRAIKTVLARRSDGKAPKLPDADELHWLGEQCSVAERRAESAGWLVDAWLKCDYLKDRVGDTFAGTIATVTEFGLFIELEGYFVQGLLHISNLGADYFNFNSRAMALEGERNGRRFVMGDALDVVIQNIEPAQGKIDLRLVGGSATRDRGRRRRQ